MLVLDSIKSWGSNLILKSTGALWDKLIMNLILHFFSFSWVVEILLLAVSELVGNVELSYG